MVPGGSTPASRCGGHCSRCYVFDADTCDPPCCSLLLISNLIIRNLSAVESADDPLLLLIQTHMRQQRPIGCHTFRKRGGRVWCMTCSRLIVLVLQELKARGQGSAVLWCGGVLRRLDGTDIWDNPPPPFWNAHIHTQTSPPATP